MRGPATHRHDSRANDERTRRALFILLALAATALIAMSCARDDAPVTAPARTVDTEIGDQALTSPAPAPAPTPANRKPATIGVVEPAEVITTSVLVLAEEGGVIDAGRHRLTIPPGALAKDTIITLKDVSGSAGYVACEALPEGLQFQRPVRLVTRFSDLRSPVDCTIFWIANPGQSDENWIDMGSSLTADRDGLTTWLSHFSSYAPGKAGWGPRGRGNRGMRAGG